MRYRSYSWKPTFIVKTTTMTLLKYFLFFVAIVTMSTACGTSRKTPKNKDTPIHDELSRYPLNFMRSEYLSDVLDRAKKEKKLVFIDLYADWCAPCKVMDEELYMDEDFAATMNEHFISYKVDVEKGNGSNLNRIFSVNVLPTLLFLDADGNVLQREDGALSHSAFLNMAANAIQLAQ